MEPFNSPVVADPATAPKFPVAASATAPKFVDRSGSLRFELAGPWPSAGCREIVEFSPWPMWVLDAETKLAVDVNQAALRRYGYSRSEFLKLQLSELMPADAAERTSAMLDRGMQGPIYDGAFQHTLRDGRALTVDLLAFPVLWNGRPARFCMARDCPASGPAERELTQRERLNAMRQVVGDVVIDLGGLVEQVEACASQLGPRDPIRTASGDLNRRLTTLAAFSGVQTSATQTPAALTPENSTLDLNQCIRRLLPALRAELGDGITLESELDTNLWPAAATEADVERILSELIKNARAAMTGGGTLQIATRRLDVQEGQYRRNEPALPGMYIHLMVRDSGIGMIESARLAAFEPYVSSHGAPTVPDSGTTPYRRTGLGLSLVYGTVRQRGGSIHLHSVPEHGTRVDIYLKRAVASAANASNAEEPSLVNESKSILLVEDSASIREMMGHCLERLGYKVLRAPSAEQAMAMVANYESTLDLLITDVTLEGLSGYRLAEKLQPLCPQMRVMFISGHSQREPNAAPSAVFLEKPFRLQTLIERVKEALESN